MLLPGLVLAQAIQSPQSTPTTESTHTTPTNETARSTPSTAPTEQLQVADPYIELRTGPGRGFPIFFVAEREEWITVLMRHTDWFKVRTAGGKEGWVHRKQLETTLTEAGTPKSFRDIALDDYLQRRVELGAAWGRFQGEPMLKMWTAYRLSDTLSVEATLGQVQGLFSGTNYWHIALNVEPWSDRRISPYFGIGAGKFKNFANVSLVAGEVTDADQSHAMLGLRYYLTERFMLRADYTFYTAFVAEDRTDEFRALTVGLSFFF